MKVNKTLGALVGSVAVLASYTVEAKTTINMATSWGGGHFMDLGAKAFENKLEFLADGDIDVVVYVGGTLGNPLTVSESVKTGLADAGHSSPLYDWGANPANIMFGGWTGGLTSEQMMNWLYEDGGADLYMKFRLETAGVIEIPCGMTPREAGMHSAKPIRTLNDFKGLKIRTAGVWSKIVSTLGASPVSLPAAEIFPALERGVIDAIEWNSFSLNKAEGFHNVAKYLIVPGIHQPVVVTGCSFNPKVWENLTERQRELIKLAARDTTISMYEQIRFDDLDAYRFFKDSGIEIIELDEEVQKAVDKSTAEWVAATTEKQGQDSWFVKIYQNQVEFQKKWNSIQKYR